VPRARPAVRALTAQEIGAGAGGRVGRPSPSVEPSAPSSDASQRSSAPCNSRDRAIALIPFYAGARIAEIVGLDTDDVRLLARKGILRICGKDEKVREIPIDPQLRATIRGWLDERPDWPGAESPALFLLPPSSPESRGADDDVVGRLVSDLVDVADSGEDFLRLVAAEPRLLGEDVEARLIGMGAMLRHDPRRRRRPAPHCRRGGPPLWRGRPSDRPARSHSGRWDRGMARPGQEGGPRRGRQRDALRFGRLAGVTPPAPNAQRPIAGRGRFVWASNLVKGAQTRSLVELSSDVRI
jgi:hypothetical protein